MSSETAPSGSQPALAALRVILAEPPANDHDAAQAYGSLADHLRLIRHTQDTGGLLPHLKSRFHDVAKTIRRNILYAADHLQWLEREGLEIEMEDFEAREPTFGAALRCFNALRLFDVLCRFYDEILGEYNKDVLSLLEDLCAIVGSASTAYYYEQEDIRPKAAYTLRARLVLLPAAVLENLYEPYTAVVLSVLQNEDYVQNDDDVLHYCVLSIANLIAEHPSTALPHLAPLLPELYPLLTTPHTTLRTRVGQAITGLAHAYAFYPTPATTSVSFERALEAPLRDWAKVEAKRRHNDPGDTFWNRLRESKRGGGTWGLRVCAALIVLLGRRVWWLPHALHMLTFPIRAERRSASVSSSAASSNDSATFSTAPAPAPVSEEAVDDGLTRAELTADIYRLLARTFARMRLWQQDHGKAVSYIEKGNDKGMPIADIALGIVLKYWPSRSRASTPEPHQPTYTVSTSTDDAYTAATAFVPAILCALGPKADEEDRTWNIKAAIEILRRMLQDGAREGEEMLTRLVGVAKDEREDIEMGSEDEMREAVLGRLLSRRALGKADAPVEPAVGAGDIRALKTGDIQAHWKTLTECWGLLVQRNPYSENVVSIFEALLASHTTIQQKVQLLDDLPKHILLPPHGDATAYEHLSRLWEVALNRFEAAETVKSVAQALLRKLLAAPPATADGVSTCTSWVCLACLVTSVDAQEWGPIEKVVHAMATNLQLDLTSSYVVRLAAALARTVPLRAELAADDLDIISRTLEAAYDALPSPPNSAPSSAASMSDPALLPAFSILSALRTNIISRGIGVHSAIALTPGVRVWIGDERRVIPDEMYNDKIVKLFEALLEAVEPPSVVDDSSANTRPRPVSDASELMTLSDLCSLTPLLEAAMSRLPPPGHAADVFWPFWSRVNGRLGLKGEEYPPEIQGVVSALCRFLGHEVPEGMETQEEEIVAGTPSIGLSQPLAHPGSEQTQGQTSSAMYWAAQSSVPSRLLQTQPPLSVSAKAAPSTEKHARPATAQGGEPSHSPAKRRRLSPEGEDGAQSHSRWSSQQHHQPSTSGRSQRQPQAHASSSRSRSDHPHTASSTRSRKSHLPTPAPSEGPLSSPIPVPDELPVDGDDEEWDGDEGMIIDEEDEEDEEDEGGGGSMEHASGSAKCARGEAEDVPGVGYGDGVSTSRSLFGSRYTYSRKEKEEDEIVPATPGADDDSVYDSPMFFAGKRKRPVSSASPLLTFNLSYSHAGPSTGIKPLAVRHSYSDEGQADAASPSAHFSSSQAASTSIDAPVQHPYSDGGGQADAGSPSPHFSYSERGSIEILRNLPRGQGALGKGAGASATNAPVDWDEESGDIPGFGGGDIPGFGTAGQELEGVQRDESRGSLEMLRDLTRGPPVVGAGVGALHTRGMQDEEAGDIPGLDGEGIPGLVNAIPGLGIAGDEVSGVPSFESLVEAIDTVEAFVARAPWDEKARAQLERLRGIMARFE